MLLLLRFKHCQSFDYYFFFAHLFEARATQKCVPETKDTMIMMMLRFGRMKQYND